MHEELIENLRFNAKQVRQYDLMILMIFAACFAVHNNKEQNTTDWHRIFLTRAVFDEWIEEIKELEEDNE